MRGRYVVFQEDQTLGPFDRASQFKGTSDDVFELMSVPLSLVAHKCRGENR